MQGELRIDGRVIEPRANTIRTDQESTRIEPKVMQVLLHLARQSGEVVSKEKLLQSVWADTFVTEDVLTRSISALRKVFDDDPRHPRVIETIPKSGYRLIAPVAWFADEAAEPRRMPDLAGPRPQPTRHSPIPPLRRSGGAQRPRSSLCWPSRWWLQPGISAGSRLPGLIPSPCCLLSV